MGINYNPGIVTNGLVLCLDAGNPRSYSPNVIPNPTDIYGWCASAGASNATLSRDTTISPSPANGIPLKMAVTGNDPYIASYSSSVWNLAPAAAGQTWTASCYVKASSPVNAGFFIFGANSSGVYIEEGHSQVPITTEWTRTTLSYTLSDPNTAYVQLRLDGPDSGGTGVNVWWDGLQLQRGASATAFNPKPNLNNGNCIDVASNNNMTVAGSPLYSPEQGWTFVNGSTSTYMIKNPFNIPTNTITCECWCKTTVAGTSIISYASSAADNDFLIFDPGNISIYVGLTSTASGINITDGNWKQIVRTRNSTSGTEILYVNGVAVYSTTMAAGTLITGGGSLVLAQEQDSIGGTFDPVQAFGGNISIVRIYDGVLTAQQVWQNFNAQRGRYGI